MKQDYVLWSNKKYIWKLVCFNKQDLFGCTSQMLSFHCFCSASVENCVGIPPSVKAPNKLFHQSEDCPPPCYLRS